MNTPATPTRHLSRWLRIAAGVAALSAIWWIASQIVAELHLPVSGGVVGLIVLVLLLLSGKVPVHWFASGAEWMLAELILFFVPAIVSIIRYGSLLRHDGLRLMLIIVTGTVLVMVVTGFVVEAVTRLESGARARRIASVRRRRLAASNALASSALAASTTLTPSTALTARHRGA